MTSSKFLDFQGSRLLVPLFYLDNGANVYLPGRGFVNIQVKTLTPTHPPFSKGGKRKRILINGFAQTGEKTNIPSCVCVCVTHTYIHISVFILPGSPGPTAFLFFLWLPPIPAQPPCVEGFGDRGRTTSHHWQSLWRPPGMEPLSLVV